MPTSQHPWKEIDEALDRLLEEPEDVRRDRLQAIESDRPALARELRGLLQGVDAPDGIFSRSVPEAAPQLFDQASAPWHLDPFTVGDRVGPYRIGETLGRGGMGVVFAAERADGQFDQAVAIKVMQGGLRDEDHRRRFLAERQLLASFNHPRIARLFDGGLTENGAPYLVMEQVHGEPIDRHCVARSLSLAARIELFLQVCDAVSYAHSRFVIHRDLKPANILVDEHGETKLLDFGVAELRASVGEQSVADEPMLMTLEYCAPEQLEEGQLSAGSDIYSLGVVLYELLTDHRPYSLEGRSIVELRRIICKVEPAAPSGVATTTWSHQLRGDLDAIILKTLRKRPEDRYSSVEALTQDLRRTLDGHPVTARPASTGYRLSCFLRRHRTASILATFLAMAMIAGTLSTWFQARQARVQRDHAEQEARSARRLLDLMVDLVESNDPAQTRGRELSAADLFERAAIKVDEELAGQPREQATLLLALGKVYARLGRLGEASQFLDRGLTLQRQLATTQPSWANSVSLLEGLLESAHNTQQRGEQDAAAPLFDEIAAMLPGIYSPTDRERLVYEQELGNWQIIRGQPSMARPHFDACLRIAQQHQLPIPEADCLNDLATSGLIASRERVTMLRRAIDLYRAQGEIDAPNVLVIRGNAALAMHQTGEYAASETEYRAVLAVQETILGSDHEQVGRTLGALAALLLNAGKLTAAKEALQRSIRLLETGGHHKESIQVLAARINLVRTQLEQKPSQQAVRQLTELRDRVVELFSERPGYVALARLRLAEALLAVGRADAALAELQPALVDAERSFLNQRDGGLLQFHHAIGTAHAERGRCDTARPYLEAASEAAETTLPYKAWRRGLIDIELGGCLATGNDLAKGRQRIERGLTALTAARGTDDWRVQRALRQQSQALGQASDEEAAASSEASPRKR